MSYESITQLPRVRDADPKSLSLAMQGISHDLEGEKAENAFRLLFGAANRAAFAEFKAIARKGRDVPGSAPSWDCAQWG